MTRYLIVGNGVAGTTAAQTIRKADPQGNIVVLSNEDLPYYSRIRLPEYIADEIQEEALVIRKEQWYQDHAIEIRLQTQVASLDHTAKELITQSGERLAYDKILLATGSRSFIPPIPGSDMAGVFTLRNVGDARGIKAYAENSANVIVIGGGVLGLETANALIKLGKKASVVEFMDRLLPRQTDNEGAKRLQEVLEGMGFSFRLDSKTKEISGDGQVQEVLLESGEKLPADMVIISAGVRPCMELATPLNLDCDMAVVVDDHMRTSMEDVFAAGDVIQFNGRPYGIWPAASDQGRIAGSNMAGQETVYQGTPMANTLKVAGVELAAAGNLDPDNQLESVVHSDGSTYRKVVYDQGRIVGCIMLGDKTGFTQVTRAMGEKKDLSRFKGAILTPGFDFRRLVS